MNGAVSNPSRERNLVAVVSSSLWMAASILLIVLRLSHCVLHAYVSSPILYVIRGLGDGFEDGIFYFSVPGREGSRVCSMLYQFVVSHHNHHHDFF